jgi:hypothetical protein
MSLPDHTQQQPPRRPPYFFREEYAGLIVKGNFMTLAAKPVHVDDGEWLAHQGSLIRPSKAPLTPQSSSSTGCWTA